MLAARSPDIESIPLVRAAVAKSPDERAQLFEEKLSQPKATRPRTLKALRAAIAGHFHKQLSESEIAAIVGAMEKSKRIRIVDGKVLYLGAS